MLAKIVIALVLLPNGRAIRLSHELHDDAGIDFMACTEPQPCGSLPSRWMGDLVEAADKRVRAANHTPVILHIGGGGFEPGNWIDSGLYNAVHATGPVRFWLVESSSDLMPQSRRNLKLLNFDGVADIIHAFIMDDCADTHFYWLDMERVKEDFGIDFVWNWESTDRDHVRYVLRGQPYDVMGTYDHPPLPLDYNERYWSLVNAPNLSAYIVPKSLPCLTPARLLEEINVKPEELAMVVTDIEGADVAVMNAFLDIPDFRPDYIQIEQQKDQSQKVHDLVTKMHKHGYSVGRQSHPSGYSEQNLVCVPSTAA